jgi:Sulfatase.
MRISMRITSSRMRTRRRICRTPNTKTSRPTRKVWITQISPLSISWTSWTRWTGPSPSSSTATICPASIQPRTQTRTMCLACMRLTISSGRTMPRSPREPSSMMLPAHTRRRTISPPSLLRILMRRSARIWRSLPKCTRPFRRFPSPRRRAVIPKTRCISMPTAIVSARRIFPKRPRRCCMSISSSSTTWVRGRIISRAPVSSTSRS